MCNHCWQSYNNIIIIIAPQDRWGLHTRKRFIYKILPPPGLSLRITGSQHKQYPDWRVRVGEQNPFQLVGNTQCHGLLC